MTGIGEARLQDEQLTVHVEVRAVNNRHLKLTCRISDRYSALEPELERLVREHVRRGTVQVSVRVERPVRVEDYSLNLVALSSYRDQLRSWLGNAEQGMDLSALLSLPGVVQDRAIPNGDDGHADWPILLGVVRQALERFQTARSEEGRAMSEELLSLGASIEGHLREIAARGPEVVAAYQARLLERTQGLVAKQGISIDPEALIREVAIFAERGDIAEELTRLKAHLEQYDSVIRGPESAGRKLEFILQEMGRETNTIGSKANDVAISRAVVEIKGLLEKARELIQNIE